MNTTKQYIKQIIAKKEAAVAELREWERQHPNFYPSERERARSEINARLMAELSEISAAAQSAARDFAARVEAKRPRFNPTSKEFLEIGNIISLYGDKMPENVQEEITRRYKNNADALRSLLPLFERNRLSVAYNEAKEALRTMERANMSTVEDGIFYACMHPERREEENIINNLEAYAEQMGVDNTGAPIETMPGAGAGGE